jgi:hypothetical protein
MKPNTLHHIVVLLVGTTVLLSFLASLGSSITVDFGSIPLGGLLATAAGIVIMAATFMAIFGVAFKSK